MLQFLSFLSAMEISDGSYRYSMHLIHSRKYFPLTFSVPKHSDKRIVIVYRYSTHLITVDNTFL